MVSHWKNPFLQASFPIVVSLTDKTPQDELGKIKSSGVEILEFRIDRFDSIDPGHVLAEISRCDDFLIIATLRSEREGGSWPFGEEDRLQFYEFLLPHVNAVDVEISSKFIVPKLVKKAHTLKKTCILSFHDFEKTPPLKTLERIHAQGKKLGGDIIKIATAVRDQKDLKNLAALTLRSSASNPLITIGMGQDGMVSRLFFPYLGSLLTYTHAGEATAPGQVHYQMTASLMSQLND